MRTHYLKSRQDLLCNSGKHMQRCVIIYTLKPLKIMYILYVDMNQVILDWKGRKNNDPHDCNSSIYSSSNYRLKTSKENKKKCADLLLRSEWPRLWSHPRAWLAWVPVRLDRLRLEWARARGRQCASVGWLWSAFASPQRPQIRVWELEFRINIYTVIYIKDISKGTTFESRGRFIEHTEITYMQKEPERG